METGELSEMAVEVMSSVDTYWEISPSGTGVKGICRATSPPGVDTTNEAGTIEIYSRGRYFTVTSQRVEFGSSDVEVRQDELKLVWEKFIGCEQSRKAPTTQATRHETKIGSDPIIDAPLTAMLRIVPRDEESDGSDRLFAIACRAVEHDLSDDDAVVAIRKYSQLHPFPVEYSDAEILLRVRSAEKKETVERGSAWQCIDAGEKDLAIISPLAWKALHIANSPPTIFRCAGTPSRIETGDDGEPEIRHLDACAMRYHLARAAKWQVWVESRGIRNITPPMTVVGDVLATPNPSLPILHRIVEAPVFAADGTLQTSPGYHSASQTFYSPADGFVVAELPECPSIEEIQVAKELICSELLGDFPFVGDAERANAVALLLLPFARDLIAGPTPLHLLEKPTPGTGATLLVEMLAFPALGRTISAMTEGRDEDEWRKRLTAKLRTGASFLLIDNLRYRLDSAAVSSAITASYWEDRILGESEVTRLPVRCVWIATGNNPMVSTEVSRRTVRVRMDAKVDRPWERKVFRHPYLREWVADNRPALVHAALTLIQAWIAAGKPKGELALGMFEKWSEVMGGILQVAGIEGFLSNINEFYDSSDEEGNAWRAFLGAWWDKFGDKEIGASDLLKLVTPEMPLQIGEGSEHSQKCTLGKLLTDRRDRVFNMDGEPSCLVIKRGEQRQRAYMWHLAISA